MTNLLEHTVCLQIGCFRTANQARTRVRSFALAVRRGRQLADFQQSKSLAITKGECLFLFGLVALYLSSVLLLESRSAAKHTGLPLKSNIDNTLFKYILGIHARHIFGAEFQGPLFQYRFNTVPPFPSIE